VSRYFVNEENIRGNNIYITGSDVTHMSRVLRLKTGDKINIVDNNGILYECEILEINDSKIKTLITDIINDSNEPSIDITLYQGLPKGDKFEFVIQKAVELGVKEIVPLITSRVVVKLDEKSSVSKLDRWQKISNEASKQCNRTYIPSIIKPVKIEKIKELLLKHDLIILAYEAEKNKTLRALIKNYNNPKNVGIIIGPEGGFSQNEVDNLVSNNANCVSLGKRILRTETAGLSVISVLMYEYDNN
jgi:16S rRNA (uracil1498-N3)-methyltransferase